MTTLSLLSRNLRRCLALACLAAAFASHADVAGLQAQLDRVVQQGDDAAAARRTLDALKAAVQTPAEERSWWLARGTLLAIDGQQREVQEAVDRLEALARAHEPLAHASAELLQGEMADRAGRFDLGSGHAQAALADYERLCLPTVGPAVPGCDYRLAWRAHQMLAARAHGQGIVIEQRNHWRAAADIAHEMRDPYREAWSLSLVATTYAQDKDFAQADELAREAERLARLDGRPLALAQVRNSEADIASRRGDFNAELRATEEGARLAREASDHRFESVFLINLSDGYTRHGRYREALKAAEQGLVLVRARHNTHFERALLHNLALAKAGLHDIAGAKKDFDQALKLAQGTGEGSQATMLREFGDALANVGDFSGALDMYHRERKLATEVMARNRESALRDLQQRYDREAKQRSIELLERDNAVKGAQIHNRKLLQRVWTLLALTLGVGAVFAVLLYLRVRETQRQLEHSHARLRVQSERDPLTGLANRRHFHDAMKAHDRQEAFEGSLLLVDIDHFKHVNDTRGHAAGDEVLVEIGRRLAEAVRAHDLVVRWGGEEFLIYAPALTADAIDAFADRLLHAIGDAPVTALGEPLRITASMGHARFPLAPAQLPLGWERAVNLVDMALYTAKSLGRNRAAGIAAVAVADDESMRGVEADFERAWTDGIVTLTLIEGPGEASPVAAAA